MKRKEEIVRQAVKEQSQLYQPPEWRAGFISGAKWADRTMLDRACKWLESVLACGDDYIGDEVVIAYKYETVGEFITAFRQAMKGE